MVALRFSSSFPLSECFFSFFSSFCAAAASDFHLSSRCRLLRVSRELVRGEKQSFTLSCFGLIVNGACDWLQWITDYRTRWVFWIVTFFFVVANTGWAKTLRHGFDHLKWVVTQVPRSHFSWVSGLSCCSRTKMQVGDKNYGMPLGEKCSRSSRKCLSLIDALVLFWNLRLLLNAPLTHSSCLGVILAESVVRNIANSFSRNKNFPWSFTFYNRIAQFVTRLLYFVSTRRTLAVVLQRYKATLITHRKKPDVSLDNILLEESSL